MNLSFGAIVLLLFFLPSLVFRKFYYFFPFSKAYQKNSLFEELSSLLIITLLIQFGFIYHLSNNNKEIIETGFKLFKTLETCKTDSSHIELSNFLKQGYGNLFLHYVYLLIISAFFGWLLNSVIRFFKLDCLLRFLRFKNDWYYYFTAKIFDFPDQDGTSEFLSLITADVLVNVNGESYIYSGILNEYYLSKDGGLENIILVGASRRNLKHDKKSDEEDNNENWYDIPSITIPNYYINKYFYYL